jgi:hypothetical protein
MSVPVPVADVDGVCESGDYGESDYRAEDLACGHEDAFRALRSAIFRVFAARQSGQWHP